MNNEWVKIKKLGDVPGDDELVFVALRDGTVTTAYHKSGLYFDEYERIRLKNVTHWMSYPKHPLAFKF